MLDQSPFKSEDFKRSVENPGALVNVNYSALEQYKKAKQTFRNRDQKLNSIDQLSDRLDRLESLMVQLLEKIK